MVARMSKRLAVGFAVVIAIATLAVGAVLVPAHVGIRVGQERLPSPADVRAVADAIAEVPVRLRWLNTASQAFPRTAVLGRADPHPQRPYRLSHSVFIAEWADGRMLLIDAGMSRTQAADFGRLGEWVGGAPIDVLTTVAEALEGGVARIAGIAFTHLHVDHVDGVRDLCRDGAAASIAVFLNRAQAQRTNHTTGDALAALHAVECLRPVELQGTGGPLVLDGFPGVFLVPVGGHTPGSQVIVVVHESAGQRRIAAVTGDVVNHIDGINFDIGKPLLYRLFVVPEDEGRLSAVRRWLRDLRDLHGVDLLVPHDELALDAAGIERLSAPMADAGANRGDG